MSMQGDAICIDGDDPRTRLNNVAPHSIVRAILKDVRQRKSSNASTQIQTVTIDSISGWLPCKVQNRHAEHARHFD